MDEDGRSRSADVSPRADAPEAGAARILRLLLDFDVENAPRRVEEMLSEADVSRSTGYPIIAALAASGYLAKAGASLYRLGPRAADLAYVLRGPTRKSASSPFAVASSGAAAKTELRRLLPPEWDPRLTELQDASAHRRPPPHRIGFSNASLSNPWRHALFEGMREAAARRRSHICELVVRNAEDDPDRQADDIAAFIAEGVDLLIVSVAQFDHPRLEASLCAVRRAGVPIVAVDRRPTDQQSFISFVTASDRKIGGVMARWLAERIGRGGRVWMLCGDTRTSPAERRKRSALEVFGQFPEIVVTSCEETEWSPEKGYAITSDLLSRRPPPDGVWCDSGQQGIGSVDAFVDAGFGKGEIPPHTGGDLNGMYKRVVQHRVPFAAVDYPASMGARAITCAIDVLAGRPTPRRIECDLQVIVSRGSGTRSVRADDWAELHVRWDMPDDFIVTDLRPQRSAAETARSVKAARDD